MTKLHNLNAIPKRDVDVDINDYGATLNYLCSKLDEIVDKVKTQNTNQKKDTNLINKTVFTK